jgi:hypothetical protein
MEGEGYKCTENRSIQRFELIQGVVEGDNFGWAHECKIPEHIKLGKQLMDTVDFFSSAHMG